MATKRRRLTREIVVERAVEMVNAEGSVEALTMKALARSLRVRTPSLYNHIDDVDDLRHEMTVFAGEQLVEALQEAVAGRVGRPALVAMAERYRQFAHSHPGVYPLVIRAPEPGDDRLDGLAQRLLQLLLLVLGSLGFEGDAALHAVRGLRSVLHGFVSLERAGGFKMALDRDESFHLLLDSYLAGLLGQTA